MRKIFFIWLFFLNGIVIAQIDTSRTLKTDTATLNTNKNNLLQVTTELIDGSASKKSLDSVELETKKTQEELARLERAVTRNEREITAKKRELKALSSDKDSLGKKIADFKTTLDKAMKDYDTMKNAIVQMQKDAVELALKQDTIKKKSDSITAKTNAVQAEYNRLLVEISKKEDSIEAIAKIKLYKTTIVLNGDPNKMQRINSTQAILSKKVLGIDSVIANVNRDNADIIAESAKVESVHLSVKEGRIVEIIVKTDKGIFRNKRAQIDLVHFSERRYSDKLFRDDQSPHDSIRSFIYSGDAITYEPIRSFGDIPYSEFEITLTPDSSGDTYIIRESTSINTYFDVAAFTDINGIAGSANGLAQITGSAKFITSTRNKASHTLMGLQYISFNGGLAKFDNDFKGTFINNKDSVDRKDLFQRTQYMVGIKVNLLRSVRSPYPNLLFNDLQINTGFNFLGSKIADTLLKSTDTLFRTVTHNQFYIEPIVSFSRQKNFNMSFALPVFYQNLKESSGIANRDWEWWICPSINLMYYSKRDSKSKIFFRYNHFINLSNKKQAFNQMQLGYAANLTNIMQGK